jgi:chloramphenicol 3-O-phosphotransferase
MKTLDSLKTICDVAEATSAHSDSRVIVREREVELFKLHACEDHLVGLRASMDEVERKKARIQARIDGLTRVLDKR